MALSNELISQFVKATQDKEQTKKESTAYGKIVKNGDTEYVQLDGSDLLTPILSTTVVKDGDRVMVTIKNHTATVTGDLTTPSASNKDVQEIGSKISDFEIVIADKVSTEQLEAEVARIEKLRTDDLTATNAKIETIEGKVAKIDTIEADVVEVNKKLTAHEGEFTTLRADIADFKDVTAGRVDAVEGNFNTLNSDYADFKELTTNKIEANEGKITTIEADVIEVNKKITADEASFNTLNSDYANFKQTTTDSIDAIEGNFNTLNSDYGSFKELTTNKLEANEGNFNTLNSDYANFKQTTTDTIDAIEGNFDTLNSDYGNFKQTTTNNLTANTAAITKLQTDKLDATQADIKYATIDFSNIGEAAIEKLFTDSGIIKDLIMSDGKVTGHLVGVTITGDLIEGNTVKADKLVIQGEDGLYYKLNVNALGETTASSDQKYQNGLDGSVIVANSITAEKIAVQDLVAFGATIGGFHIADHALYSGAKNSVDNTLQGIFLGDDGQAAIGDSNNYLKFFVDENGEYKLEIQADQIKFGSSNTTISDAINSTAQTLIEENDELIRSDIDKKYVSADVFNDFKETTETQFTVQSEGIEAKFTSMTLQVENMDDEIQAKFRELAAYIRQYMNEEGKPVIELGSLTNNIILKILNDRISFTQSGSEVAYVSDNTLYITDGQFLNSLRVGQFAFIPRANGSLDFKKVLY